MSHLSDSQVLVRDNAIKFSTSSVKPICMHSPFPMNRWGTGLGIGNPWVEQMSMRFHRRAGIGKCPCIYWIDPGMWSSTAFRIQSLQNESVNVREQHLPLFTQSDFLQFQADMVTEWLNVFINWWPSGLIKQLEHFLQMILNGITNCNLRQSFSFCFGPFFQIEFGCCLQQEQEV